MILAIDPSILSLGWAVLTYDNGVHAKLGTDAHPRLEAFGTVKRATGHLPLEQRIDIIIEGLDEALSTHALLEVPLKLVVIEKPELWGAFRSIASLHSGALLGLHILTGALYWWANTNFEKAYLIPVTEWKGQLKKEITQKRMEKKYDVKFKTDDESDATGLGDYWLTEGQFK